MIDIRKAKIGNGLYTVTSWENFINNRELYDQGNVAIDDPNLGYVLPIRAGSNVNQNTPGVYVGDVFSTFVVPTEYNEEYSRDNITDLGNAENTRDLFDKMERIKSLEKEVLVTTDNITVPLIKDTDKPAMKAVKEAIISKHCNMDLYAGNFGNYNNDKNLLNGESISLPKIETYCNALDLTAYLVIEDKNPDVPNPMGKTIKYQLNGFGG